MTATLRPLDPSNREGTSIEISRHLYMNEVTLEKTDNFGAVRQIVERLVVALIGLDPAVLLAAAPADAKLAAE